MFAIDRIQKHPAAWAVVVVTVFCGMVAGAGAIAAGEAGGWWPFAGRFHPALVHLPIGFAVAAGVVEALALWRPLNNLRVAGPYLVGITALSAAASAGAGFLLAAQGTYEHTLLDRHETLGLLVLATSLVAFAIGLLLRERARRWNAVYLGMLGLMLVLVTLVGHFGGSLTHGSGYLTEHMPAPLKQLLRVSGERSSIFSLPDEFDEVAVYPHLVAPILQARCVSCHGREKQEGGLRLDSWQAIDDGGEGGPSIVPGNAWASELVRRISLPPGHEDAMPPAPRGHVTVAEADVLRWWIETGASADASLSSLEWTPPVQLFMDAIGMNIAERRTGIFLLSIPPASETAVVAVREAGFHIEPVAEGEVFLRVRPAGDRATVDDERVAGLLPIARNIAWLDLGRTRATDQAFTTISRMPHLTRLNMERTSVSGSGLGKLTGLAYLENLNLYGTSIGDEALHRMADFPALKVVYLWQTKVSDQGVADLRAVRTDLEVVRGVEERTDLIQASVTD